MIATTIEQSKHLLKLGLDPSTADMYYLLGNPLALVKWIKSDVHLLAVTDIPAWSLSALLNVMPEFYPELHLYRDGDWYCRCDQVESEYCDDPIIAVYDVVCWLLDHNAIKNIHEHE